MPVSRAIRGVGQSINALLRDQAASRRERATERLDIANLGFRERKEESEFSLRRVSAERESYLDTPSTLGEILSRSDLEKRSPKTFKMFTGLLDRKNPITGNFFKDEITTPRQAVAMVQQFQLENSKQKERAAERTSRETLAGEAITSREEIARLGRVSAGEIAETRAGATAESALVRSKAAAKKDRAAENRRVVSRIRALEKELFDLDKNIEEINLGSEDMELKPIVEQRRFDVKRELTELRNLSVPKSTEELDFRLGRGGIGTQPIMTPPVTSGRSGKDISSLSRFVR